VGSSPTPATTNNKSAEGLRRFIISNEKNIQTRKPLLFDFLEEYNLIFTTPKNTSSEGQTISPNSVVNKLSFP